MRGLGRLLLAVGRVATSTLRYGMATRRLGVVVVVLVGFALVAVTVAAQAAAPFVLYPFV